MEGGLMTEGRSDDGLLSVSVSVTDRKSLMMCFLFVLHSFRCFRPKVTQLVINPPAL